MKNSTPTLPVPVESESRICFGIHWFATEEEAKTWGAHSEQSGNTYNGGFYHGRPCGRDPNWDYTDETGRKLYAATF